MYETLTQFSLPVDRLIRQQLQDKCFRSTLDTLTRKVWEEPIKNLITLEMVSHSAVEDAVRRHISRLLQEKEKYGYIYFLNDQPMLLPFNVHFGSVDVVVDCTQKWPIANAVTKLAAEYSEPDTTLFKITLMEIYYFLILIINPTLTWLALESILNSVRMHTHLIMSSHRKYPYVDSKEEAEACSTKNATLFPKKIV